MSASKSGHSATPIPSLDVATRNRVGVDAPPTSSEPVWTDAVQFVGGRAFPQDERTSPFDRLPASAAAGVGPAVWQLSEMSTGLYLRFATDAHLISLRWTLRTVCAEKWPSGCHLPEMPDSGTNSFDTYVAHPFQSQHCESEHGVSRPNPNYQHVFRSNHNFQHIEQSLKSQSLSHFLSHPPPQPQPPTPLTSSFSPHLEHDAAQQHTPGTCTMQKIPLGATCQHRRFTTPRVAVQRGSSRIGLPRPIRLTSCTS